MEHTELYRQDIKLLLSLSVFIEEGSVSKAAPRLNLSQSATSRLLSRLRELLDDPLFIRQGHQLIPTQRAIEVNSALQQPLASIASILSSKSFEASSCHETFNIAATDYAMQTILPFTLPQIYQQAPHLSLHFMPLQQNHLTEQLISGQCDMAIGRPFPEDIVKTKHLQQQYLGKVAVSCLISQHHPLANSELTLEDYLHYPLALIAISDGVKSLIDQAMPANRQANYQLRAYHLEAALNLVESLPLIIVVPADLAFLVADKLKLVYKKLPFHFNAFDYTLIWHSRTEHSGAQQWLRNNLIQQSSELIQQRLNCIGLE